MSRLVHIQQTYWTADTTVQERAKLDRLESAILNRPYPVEVIVRRYQKPRSPEANAYLWSVCYALMSEASGYEREEIHLAMCKKFFGTKVVEIMGEKFELPIRTTTHNEDGEKEWLGSAPFADLVDMVIREAAYWYDLAIPEPQPKGEKDGRAGRH